MCVYIHTAKRLFSVVTVKNTYSLDKVALVEMEQSKTFLNISVLILTGFDDEFHIMVSGGGSRMTAKFLACAIKLDRFINS